MLKFHSLLISSIIPALVVIHPGVASAQTAEDVNQLARETTVIILGKDQTLGSGVIVSRDNNTYYVLTANHVMGGSEYKIVTVDGRQHTISPNVNRLPNEVDLAIISFDSNQTYQVAKLGSSNYVEPGLNVFVSGWPKPGQVLSETNQLVRHFSSGNVSAVLPDDFRGYQIGYNNVTQGGMSGGPVFDIEGRVVAIHGLADHDLNNAEELKKRGIDPNTGAELSTTGFNYGIPIDAFTQQLPYNPEIYNGVEIDPQPPSQPQQEVDPEVTEDTEFSQDLANIFKDWLKDSVRDILPEIPRIPIRF